MTDAIHHDLTYAHALSQDCYVDGVDLHEHHLVAVDYVVVRDISTWRFTCLCGVEWTGFYPPKERTGDRKAAAA